MQNPTLIPVSALDEIDRVELAGFAQIGINLSDAVEIAEKYAFGKAVSGGLAEADGELIFLVVVVANGRLKEVTIDPSSQN